MSRSHTPPVSKKSKLKKGSTSEQLSMLEICFSEFLHDSSTVEKESGGKEQCLQNVSNGYSNVDLSTTPTACTVIKRRENSSSKLISGAGEKLVTITTN